nr:retrovirus-related Pol polyprotein from transposon TNT 1-94 [Tanacetum cinerariifolium]
RTKKEIDELESDKAEFSNMYDVILQECVSKDVICSYLQSISDLDALAKLQCLYIHKVKECDCLSQTLSKQTDSVSKKVHTKLLQRFDSKAQLQDKNIAISELKKLIQKGKGKSMDAKFDGPSVVRQPNGQRIPKPSVLEGLSKPVTAQTLPQTAKKAIVQLILFIVDSGCTKHMTGNLKLLCNFVETFLETVRFGNDQFAPILGYGYLVQANVTIKRVYYVEGLNHNLFSVGQFCDADLKVAFRKSTCFVRDLQGNKLLIGSNPSMNVQSTSAPSTHTNVHAEENNNDQAEEGEQLQDDEFTNPFYAPTQEVVESSSYNIEQVCGNPSRPVQTRRQLAIDPEMYMYALTMSTAEPKSIKEAMADSTWIEVMQEELHQKALYGMKQAPRTWYDELSKFLTLKGFTKDVDHARCIDSRKSTSGGIQFLGDKLVSWMSKKQNCTSMSSTKAGYVGLSAGCAQVTWMRTQLQDYGFNYNEIPLYCDSQTEYQLADMFTKALLEDRFKYLVRGIGLRCLTPAELEILAKESA